MYCAFALKLEDVNGGPVTLGADYCFVGFP
jgi:hypothetical protein